MLLIEGVDILGDEGGNGMDRVLLCKLDSGSHHLMDGGDGSDGSNREPFTKLLFCCFMILIWRRCIYNLPIPSFLFVSRIG
jgi:hypothetical protein